MPLIVCHFWQLNPWAILAGMILSIPVLLALIGGLLKVVMTLLYPGLAWAWAAMAAWPIAWMRHMLDALEYLPGSDVAMRPPPLWMIIGYYALLSLPLMAQARKPKSESSSYKYIHTLRYAPAAGAILLGATMLLSGIWTHNDGSLRLTNLSVGAGNCAVVQLPTGKTLLIDCGSDSSDDLYRQCIEPALRRLQVRRIEEIYLTHADRDHFSAAVEVIEAFDVRRVYVGPGFLDQAKEKAAADQILQTMKRLHRPVEVMTQGRRIDLTPEIRLEGTWPPAGRSLDDNNGSLVLRLRGFGRSVLFTGDIQQLAEQELIDREPDIRSDILIAPHHGSGEPTTAQFIRTVDPQVIISSDDATPTRKQRDFETMTGARKLYHTHHCGAVTVRIEPQGTLQVDTFIKP